MKKKHARLSASAAHRWIACPGSIRLADQCPEPPSSDYAEEGTAAHALAETVLKDERVNVYSYVGKMLYIEDLDKHWKITQDMADAVNVYVDYILGLMAEVEEDCVYIEEKFDLSWIYPGMAGTNDCCVYDKDKSILHIIDYKHGKGVEVSPIWNDQLMFYALGALRVVLESRGQILGTAYEYIKEVALTVVQPRVDGEEAIKTWYIGVSQLLFWGLNVLKPAGKMVGNTSAPLRSGEHCRFCPALAVCPENVRHACDVAKTDFDHIQLPAPEDLTPEDITKVLDSAELINAWVLQIKVFTQQQLEMGKEIPGWKLVAKRANRRWLDETTVIEVLSDHVSQDLLFAEPKLRSVAQMEKVLKGSKISDNVMAGLWEKPNTGVTLAKSTDKRVGVVPQLAFEHYIEGNEDFLQ